MLKVMTIVGTRPEIIKLSRVMAELDKHCDHKLVHTGQNYDYELNEIFFKELGVRKPDYYLDAAQGSAAQTIGNVIAASDEVFAKEQPDAILVLGDTNSCLSVISAKRRKIPIFHMEAGNRSFDERVPEEINRRIVDHTSDINLTHTEHARRYLIREGIKPETIIKSGSPMKEILDYHAKDIDNSEILEKMELEKNNFFIVSIHREENVDNPDNFTNLLGSLSAIADEYKLPIIVSTHPRTKIRLEELDKVDLHELISFVKPMGFFDYVKLQKESRCIISDSGTITEESTILNLPAITIRQAHERPEGMDEGVLIMSDLEPASVLNSISIVLDQHDSDKRVFNIVDDYDVDNVSKKMVKVIHSYTGYVNRTVWRRE